MTRTGTAAGSEDGWSARVYPLVEGERVTRIGRAANNQVCIDYPVISKMHCSLRTEETGATDRVRQVWFDQVFDQVGPAPADEGKYADP